MIFSAAVGFFGVFALTQGFGIRAVWAMTAFMGLGLLKRCVIIVWPSHISC